MKRFIPYLFICFVFKNLNAQVVITTATDKFEYEIGDYIQVEIAAIGDSTLSYFWPAANEVAPYEIISVSPVDTQVVGGDKIYKQKIIYSIYEPDKYYLPQVTIPYKKASDNSAYFASSDSLPFIVKAIEVDTTANIKPIKDILEVKVVNFTPLYVFLIINLIIAVAFIIYFFFIRKEKTTPVVKPTGPQQSLYEITKEQLQLLESKKLWQQEELKLYYSELTDILRIYIEKRFSINALESTSEEILEQVGHIPETVSFVNDMTFILQLADMAKFAKSRPLPNENIRAMELANQFVELTKPIETDTAVEP
jgi:hypothetical protein